jgi:hypothetical protein
VLSGLPSHPAGLPVGFSVLSGPAVLSGNVVVRASQSGDGVCAPAPPVDQSCVVAAGNDIITEHRRLPNGKFWLVFACDFARPYVVESSANLTQWMPLVTILMDRLGNLEITDSAATNQPWRLYRVKGQQGRQGGGKPMLPAVVLTELCTYVASNITALMCCV